MMNPCVAIVASVCLHHPASVEFSYSATSSWASFQLQDAEGTIRLSADDIKTPDWSRMNIACSGGYDACVFYHKHCTEHNEKFICVYHFSQPGDAANSRVELSARSEPSINAAEKLIGILSSSRWLAAEIPLERFSKLSESKWPPLCAAIRPPKSCWVRDQASTEPKVPR
jgi:hypothetical protein